MLCGKWGKQIEDDAAVCKWCGEPVESDEESVKGSAPVHEDVQMDSEKIYKKPVNKLIQMTSLGISVGVAALCIYFSGIVNSVLVFLVAAYILLREQDSWLRAVAVKAVLIIKNIILIVAGV